MTQNNVNALRIYEDIRHEVGDTCFPKYGGKIGILSILFHIVYFKNMCQWKEVGTSSGS